VPGSGTGVKTCENVVDRLSCPANGPENMRSFSRILNTTGRPTLNTPLGIVNDVVVSGRFPEEKN
jgi:hypothetical protein